MTNYFATLFNAATAVTQSDIGDNALGAFSIFVYTVIFTVLVYNIALMCFKMVDDVPRGMLRWIGARISSLSDSRGDPINGTREMVVGGVAAGSTLGYWISSRVGGISKAMDNAKVHAKNVAEERQMDDDGPQEVKVT